MRESPTTACNSRWIAVTHPRGLNSHAAYSTVDQPVGHLLQIGRKTIEASHGLLVPLWIDGHPVFAAANVDASCMRVHNLQSFPVSFQPVRFELAVALSFLAHNFSYRWNRFSSA